MPTSLRYQQDNIRKHLAQQYALSLLTPLAAKRLETLLSDDDELKNQVNYWQATLTVIVDTIPDQQPPLRVWESLSKQISVPAAGRSKRPATGLLKTATSNLKWFWPSMCAFTTLLMCIVSFELYDAPRSFIQSSPSYMAIMHQPANDSDQQPLSSLFVLSAYQGLNPGHSQLKIQWNERQSEQRTDRNLTGLTLWSISRDNAKNEKIAKMSELLNDQAFLTKKAWIKIKNSAFLEIKRGDKIIFKGECLQLKQWQS